MTKFTEEMILRGLIEAAHTNAETYDEVSIKRDGKILFVFRVGALTEEQYDHCRKQCTVKTKMKRAGGLALPTDLDTARYNSMLILTATHPDDVATVWKNPAIFEALKVGTALDVIEKVLKAGEKERVNTIIDELSGYEDLSEMVGNSSSVADSSATSTPSTSDTESPQTSSSKNHPE